MIFTVVLSPFRTPVVPVTVPEPLPVFFTLNVRYALSIGMLLNVS